MIIFYSVEQTIEEKKNMLAFLTQCIKGAADNEKHNQYGKMVKQIIINLIKIIQTSFKCQQQSIFQLQTTKDSRKDEKLTDAAIEIQIIEKIKYYVQDQTFISISDRNQEIEEGERLDSQTIIPIQNFILLCNK